MIGAALGAALFVFWLFAVWPPPIWYASHFPARTAFMALRERSDPDSIGRAFHPLPLDSMAPAIVTAVMRGEDNRFFDHAGVDWVEMRKALGYPRDSFDWRRARDRGALWRAVRTLPGRGGDIRGASTITQQLAKNLYLSPSRNPLRKLKETVTAYRMELALEKRRIMELYVNVAELGPGIWGVPAASEAYFHKPASQLTRIEAAALAATLPFPLLSNPAYQPGRMRWRREMILGRM